MGTGPDTGRRRLCVTGDGLCVTNVTKGCRDVTRNVNTVFYSAQLREQDGDVGTRNMWTLDARSFWPYLWECCHYFGWASQQFHYVESYKWMSDEAGAGAGLNMLVPHWSRLWRGMQRILQQNSSEDNLGNICAVYLQHSMIFKAGLVAPIVSEQKFSFHWTSASQIFVTFGEKIWGCRWPIFKQRRRNR